MINPDDLRYTKMALNNGSGPMPALGFGTLIPDPVATKNATKAALEAGFRLLDTAERYRTEREVGEAMQEVFNEGKIKREDVFVVTKLWNTNHRPERVKPAFEASLTKLQLDFVDLYLIHTPFAFQPGDDQDPRDANGNVIYDKGVTLLDTWRAMEGLVSEGKCKAIGLSDVSLAQVQDIVKAAKIKPAVVHVESKVMLRKRSLQRLNRMFSPRMGWLSLAAVLILSGNMFAQPTEPAMAQGTSYRTVKVDGLTIFYREAGPPDAPDILLLHGLPSSSRMFEPLFARLGNEYHLIAPDYPGFGHSDAPTPKDFSYTFDNIATVMDHFIEALHLTRYTFYMQDYGAPVGFRMALAHPDRVESIIIQDAVAHNTGLGVNWKTRRAFWADRSPNEAALRNNLISLAATRTRHVGNDPHPEKYDPDLWTDEFVFLSKPGEADIQSDLFYDYRTNVDAYPKWQAWMQKTQPRMLVLWGKYDLSFDLSEPEAYRKDVPKAEVHILDAGHFALDTAADQIADLIRGFMSSKR